MVITGIASTSVFVKDQQESLTFWVEKVGFKLYVIWSLNQTSDGWKLPPEHRIPQLICIQNH
jgi:hypothetical protein